MEMQNDEKGQASAGRKSRATGEITIRLGYDPDGKPGILFGIPEGSFIESPDGEPQPGIFIDPSKAREFAYVFLLNAEQLSSGSVPMPPPRNKNPGGEGPPKGDGEPSGLLQ